MTGAAGSLGRRVADRLLARPQVQAVLAVDVVPQPGHDRLEAHCLDLCLSGAQEELAAVAKEADAFLHLAWGAARGGNLEALGNVLGAAAAVRPRQLVHLSSATVYGAWADNPVPLTEEAALRPNPGLAYAVEKKAAEACVARWSAEHPEVAVAVLRPACTVGPGSAPLYRALAAGNRPPLGSEGRLVQYLHLDDLAQAVVHVWERGLSGTYNVAPDNGVGEEVAGALLGGPARLPLPRRARALLSAGRWDLWRRGAPPGARPYGEHSWVVSSDKLRATGWRPQYSSEEALVVSDERPHWDELPAMWRRWAALAAGAALAGTGAGGLWLWRRRR